MLITMVMMQSLEMFPIWLFCVVVVQFSHFFWSHIFPFPLSPFPFFLSPFPFPLSPFPKYTNKLSAPTTKIRIKLKLSHTLLSTTGVQLFSKQGGSVFSVAPFLLGGGGGGGGGGLESTRQWGGGWVGGVSCEEFGVDNGGGGGGIGLDP